MMRVISYTTTSVALLFATFFPLFSQKLQDWQQKIDPALLHRASSGENVAFLTIFEQQADVSDARFLAKKEEKGAFVFQRLSETAVHTQGPVLKILEDHKVLYRSYWIVNAVYAEGGIDLIEKLAQLPEVREIQSNPVIEFKEPQRPEQTGNNRTITWGIGYINADDVWAMGYTGQGVVVGGQDTGYKWDHNALKLQYRGWNSATMTANHNYNWHDAVNQNATQNTGTNPCGYNLPSPCDDDNHGTHTMGTMVGDDGGANQIGVAPGAKWIGCRNMERGWGTFNWYLECFQWFLAPTDLSNQNPMPSLAPHVINNSWYCPETEGCNSGNYATMEAAVNNLRNAGVVVVVSAGNSGPNCSTISYPPAIFPGSFSVGATNNTGSIASFSSRGPATYNSNSYTRPNVSAPGVSVYSSLANGNYGNLSGTSMAGPHVAGAVALIISANPSLAGQVSQIESILMSTASPGVPTGLTCNGIPDSNTPNNTYGYGIINSLAAVNAALALLPIELMDFWGKLEDKGIRLFWETAPDGSLSHFEVEHADYRQDWKIAGKLAFSPQLQSYNFLHICPEPGANYYRLKMVDIDGSFSYSKIISIELPGNGNLTAFPNPAGDFLSLTMKWPAGKATIDILDFSGRIVKEEHLLLREEQAFHQLNVSTLPQGYYMLKLFGTVFFSGIVSLRSKRYGTNNTYHRGRQWTSHQHRTIPI